MSDLRVLRSPEEHRPHLLHAGERIWAETNCSVDVWVELLHALGHDPVAGLAFTLGSDFDGSQWSFIKYPLEDLRALYALDVAELNIWRSVLDHVREQLDAGNLVTVEVDAYYLPDTAGVSYRVEHTKTTIVPTLLDEAGKRLHYLHGRGLFSLGGPDFDGLFAAAGPATLPPYVELIRRRGEPPELGPATPPVRDTVTAQLANRPDDRPAHRLAAAVEADLAWLTGAGTEVFHRWAFGTIRQFGATAELAGDFAEWLSPAAPELAKAAAALREAAETARTVQLVCARAARGRQVDVAGPLAAMADSWQAALDRIAATW